MKRLVAAAALWTLFACTCLEGAEPAQNTQPALDQYLHTIGLGSRELATAAQGHPVVTLLPTANDRDLAVFGMIGLHASQETVLTHVVDLERVLAVKGRTFHIFSDPPTPSDVRDAAFAESEYRALQDCRPGECDFKLPAVAMQMFIQQIDWSAPGAKVQVDARLRQGLLQLAMDYKSRGNSATLPYDDVHGVRPGDVFLELVAQKPGLYDYAPELEGYLRNYPLERPKGVRDYLYWSEDRKTQARPTLTLNHVVVYAPPAPATGTVIVAQKQIYASHYFEGGFDLLAVVGSGPSGSEGVTYLLLTRRFRLDKLPNGVLNIRGRVRSQLTDATRSDLERLRSMIEPPQRGASDGKR